MEEAERFRADIQSMREEVLTELRDLRSEIVSELGDRPGDLGMPRRQQPTQQTGSPPTRRVRIGP